MHAHCDLWFLSEWQKSGFRYIGQLCLFVEQKILLLNKDFDNNYYYFKSKFSEFENWSFVNLKIEGKYFKNLKYVILLVKKKLIVVDSTFLTVIWLVGTLKCIKQCSLVVIHFIKYFSSHFSMQLSTKNNILFTAVVALLSKMWP